MKGIHVGVIEELDTLYFLLGEKKSGLLERSFAKFNLTKSKGQPFIMTLYWNHGLLHPNQAIRGGFRRVDEEISVDQ